MNVAWNCLLFLDIDGVLNHRGWLVSANWRHIQAGARGERFDLAQAQIDPSRVALLNDICERTGCKVVISSTWRLAHPEARMVELLGNAGFKGEVIGYTPDLDTERGLEVAAWLRHNAGPDARFVILDDNADMGALLHRLVQTSFETGLDSSAVETSVELLRQRVTAPWSSV